MFSETHSQLEQITLISVTPFTIYFSKIMLSGIVRVISQVVL